jgi:hypothetical protein
MDTLVITTENKKDLEFLEELLRKMNIPSKVLYEEDVEDIGLAYLMKDVDRNDLVDKDHILRKLSNES